MSDRPTVARAVLEMLRDFGVRTAFGLPGVHNLAFWRDAGDDTLNIMGVRHEQTTVYAADGLARATGGLGVAITTTGPGAANAAGAFGEAMSSGSPVLLIASEISTRLARPGVMRGVLHESPDQAAIFDSMAKRVYRPRTAVDAVEAVAEAAALAMTSPRGPVYVDIPTDVLDQVVEPVVIVAPQRAEPEAAALSAAVALIDAAPRVLIWAGGGVVQSEASVELAALAEQLSAPVITTWGGRGVLPAGHRWDVGLPPHEPEVRDLLAAADLLIAVGTAFDGPFTQNWTLRLPDQLVDINADPREISKNYPATVGIVGDAKLALAALSASVNRRTAVDTDLTALRDQVWTRLQAGPDSADATDFLGVIDDVGRRHDPVVIADMAIAGYWVGSYARVAGPRRLQYGIGWGTLGYALPAAVGAGAVGDRPVLVVCGDGGFMFGVGELAVLVQERLPVTVLIVDDGGYGMLRFDQDHAGDQRAGVELMRPDFELLAASFGIPAVSIAADRPVQLTAALDDALAARGPRVVVLRQQFVPPRTTSPRWHE